MGWFSLSRSSHHRPSISRASSSFSRSASYYKRRPRDGYIERLVHKFKHLLRELWYYARRNPVKIFFLVIMPLVSGGALAAFARQFGVKLPAMLSGKGGREMGGGGYYGSKGYGEEMSGMGGLGKLGSLAGSMGGGMGGVGSLMSVAKAFM
jgi:hypothetical protein